MSITILTHADTDGICSAAIVLSKHKDGKIFFTKPVSLYRDLRDVKSDKIIICDIAINRRDAKDIVRLLKQKDITYFDHHPIPENITKDQIECKFIHSTKSSASELVYKHLKKDIPRERVWIAIYGAIADYVADTSFIKKRVKNWDIRALYYEASTLSLGITENGFSRYHSKRQIAELLSQGRNPSEIKDLAEAAKRAVGKEFELYKIIKNRAIKHNNIGYAEDVPNFGFRGPSALFAATITDSPVGMSVYFTGRHIDITMRSRNGKIPLNTVAYEAANFVGGSGGGHPTAAGCRIPPRTFGRFLKKLDEMISAYIH